MGEGAQRLDVWLWCARLCRSRADCARLIAEGGMRINRQPTEKPHARLRPGDVLTLPLPTGVRVWRVLALATRRGPAGEARLLYEEIAAAGSGRFEEPAGPGPRPLSCVGGQTTAYPPAEPTSVPSARRA
jgi:ribosome-associated heat shock protein Hsp15